MKKKHRGQALLRRDAAKLFAALCVTFVLSRALFDQRPRRDKKGLRIKEIQRIQAGTVSAKEFFAKFGDDVPVIVEGEVKHHPAYNMSFDTLKEVCGKSMVETMVFDRNSKLWGGLVDKKYMLLSEYVDNHVLNQGNQTSGEPPRYLTAGLGLPQICPRLELYAPVPKYVSLSVFPIDEVQYEQTKKRNQILMPVMFIGNKGTKTEMHVDMMLGPFWMSVYSGSKTFRVVTYWDARRRWDLFNKRGKGNHLLDHTRWERGGEIMEIWNPNLDIFPEVGEVTIYEGKVNAGDWIYLPSAAFHGVRNDDLSWGITINALYPATMNKQVDVCADSGYRLSCDGYYVFSDCPMESYLTTSSWLKKWALKQCYRQSALVQGLKREFDESRARDMFLHEISGFENYQSWCQGQCELYRTHARAFGMGAHLLENVCRQCQS